MLVSGRVRRRAKRRTDVPVPIAHLAGAFRQLPLTDAECRTLANNVALCMR